MPGVTPEQAWTWWTDFREGPHDHAFAAWAHPERRVEALDDGGLRITETARVWRWQYLEVCDLELARPRVKYEMRNNVGRFRGHYRFLPAADGTRLEVVWDQQLVRWLRWLGPLGRWGLSAVYRWDLKQHIGQMRRDLGAAPHAHAKAPA